MGHKEHDLYLPEEDELLEQRQGVMCLSGGKDSTAVLLRILEMQENDPEMLKEYPLHHIIFADTKFEFPLLYDYLKDLQKYLDEHYPHRGLTIQWLEPLKSWEDNFYGKITRGKLEGQYRGAPLKLYPCYHTRDAKVRPIEKFCHDLGTPFVQYIGIAADETHRQHQRQPEKRYPLMEWEWTEDDCLAYLEHKHMVLDLYTAFTRLGCYLCPKQSFRSWFSLWLHYPELYQKAEEWDEESLKLSGMGLTMVGQDGDETLKQMRIRFEHGFIPKGKLGMECRACNSITMVSTGQVTAEFFDDIGDEAPERDDSNPRIQELLAQDIESVEWIPPSKLTRAAVKNASFGNWFMPELDEAVKAHVEDDDAPLDDCFSDIEEE